MSTPQELTGKIKRKALELGFSKVGVTTADDFTGYIEEICSREDYEPWQNGPRGFLAKGAQPKSYYPEGKSIICAVYGFGGYRFPEELTPYIGRAYLSRAYVPEEHSLCGIRVKELRRFIEELGIFIYDGKFAFPARMACARAGLITYGKNNFAYTVEDGSFVILYTFLVDTELVYDEPTISRPCPPDCRLCIEACPTHAIVAPGRLHPQSCVLYNNIRKDQVPEEIREMLGTRIHGCDACQTVCPRNRKVLENARRKDRFLETIKEEFDLERVLLLDSEYYENVLYPIMYNYIRDLNLFRRNAAIALGNTGDVRHVKALKTALDTAEDPMVREAVIWALEKIGGAEAKEALVSCRQKEHSEEMRTAIDKALENMAVS